MFHKYRSIIDSSLEAFRIHILKIIDHLVLKHIKDCRLVGIHLPNFPDIKETIEEKSQIQGLSLLNFGTILYRNSFFSIRDKVSEDRMKTDGADEEDNERDEEDERHSVSNDDGKGVYEEASRHDVIIDPTMGANKSLLRLQEVRSHFSNCPKSEDDTINLIEKSFKFVVGWVFHISMRYVRSHYDVNKSILKLEDLSLSKYFTFSKSSEVSSIIPSYLYISMHRSEISNILSIMSTICRDGIGKDLGNPFEPYS